MLPLLVKNALLIFGFAPVCSLDLGPFHILQTWQADFVYSKHSNLFTYLFIYLLCYTLLFDSLGAAKKDASL